MTNTIDQPDERHGDMYTCCDARFDGWKAWHKHSQTAKHVQRREA